MSGTSLPRLPPLGKVAPNTVEGALAGRSRIYLSPSYLPLDGREYVSVLEYGSGNDFRAAADSKSLPVMALLRCHLVWLASIFFRYFPRRH